MVIDNQCSIFIQILIKFQICLKCLSSYIDRKAHSFIANITMQNFSTTISDQEVLQQVITAHERHQVEERTVYITLQHKADNQPELTSSTTFRTGTSLSPPHNQSGKYHPPPVFAFTTWHAVYLVTSKIYPIVIGLKRVLSPDWSNLPRRIFIGCIVGCHSSHSQGVNPCYYSDFNPTTKQNNNWH